MLRLRPYKESDTDAVLLWTARFDRRAHHTWCAESFPYPLSREAWTARVRRVEADGHALLMTAVTDENAPAACFMMRNIDFAAGSARVCFVLLDPALRGQGLGTALMRAAQTYAFGLLGLDTLSLGVYIHNEPAYRAYLAAGFRFVDTDYEANVIDGEVYAARDMLCWRDGPAGHAPKAAAEEMRAFFASRVDGYDAHMLEQVEGCCAAYPVIASLLPEKTQTLLDLGCGTGLELDALFPRFPALEVTGIDCTRAMLDECAAKHAGRRLSLRCEDYLESDLGSEAFDAAVSVESLHHFTHAEKRRLYRRLCRALKPTGVFIECDYMVEKPEDEQFYRAERAALGADGAGERIHYDTPCTVENECALLGEAGFRQVERVFREGNTTILLARRGESMMEIRRVDTDRRAYMPMLLIADESEEMILRYLDRGDMYALFDGEGGARCIAVITDEGEGELELKNIVVQAEHQGKGYGRAMIDFLAKTYAPSHRAMLVGTGDSPLTVPFYEKCGFVRDHVVPNFFIDNYDHPMIEEGVLLVDMVYFKRLLCPADSAESTSPDTHGA